MWGEQCALQAQHRRGPPPTSLAATARLHGCRGAGASLSTTDKVTGAQWSCFEEHAMSLSTASHGHMTHFAGLPGEAAGRALAKSMPEAL